ncbi:hypothetical protein ACOSQ2_004708 [Xanthoceras sorbifolium]
MQETTGGIFESVSSYFINLFSSYGVRMRILSFDSVNFPRRVTKDRDIGRFLAFFVKRYQNGLVRLVGSALRFLKTDVALDSSKSATGIGAVLCNCQGDVLVAISRTIPDSYTPELGE